MDAGGLLILIAGIAVLALMFAVLGRVMFQPDRSALRGITRAWNRNDVDTGTPPGSEE